MTIQELQKYHAKCLSRLTTKELFIESVPVFQLAYFHKAFPKARWTFVNYKNLFEKNTINQIFSEIGLMQKFSCKENKKVNGFSVKNHTHSIKVYKLFHKWTNALHLLKRYIDQDK